MRRWILVLIVVVVPCLAWTMENRMTRRPQAHIAKPAVATLDVHVMFTGICTLNHPPNSNNGDANPVVIDVNVPKDDIETDPLMKHHPFIAADSTYNLNVAIKGTPLKADRVHNDSNGEDFDIFWLDDADNVTLTLSKQSSSGPQKQKDNPQSSCADATTTNNLAFVPRISRVLGDASCQPNPDSYYRMKTTDGDVAAFVVNPFLQSFEPPLVGQPQGYRQQIAQAVIWTTQTTDSVMTLNGGGGSVVVQASPSSKKEVTIVMGSAPTLDFEQAAAGLVVHPTNDPHFKHYYRGCPTAPKPIPYNISKPCLKTATLPAYAPGWMKMNVFYHSAHGYGRGKAIPLVIGGLNCGPDGQP